MLVECRNKLAYGNVGIITVQHVDIHILYLQTLQARQKLGTQRFGIAVGSMRSLIQNHHLLSNGAILYPLAQDFFAQTTAIDIACIEAVSAALEEIIEHDRGMGPRH